MIGAPAGEIKIGGCGAVANLARTPQHVDMPSAIADT
jgi:hypothetical protein